MGFVDCSYIGYCECDSDCFGSGSIFPQNGFLYTVNHSQSLHKKQIFPIKQIIATYSNRNSEFEHFPFLMPLTKLYYIFRPSPTLVAIPRTKKWTRWQYDFFCHM